MFKIHTVVGARPQFIKAAVVSRELLTVGTVEESIIHTGQHYDQNMSEVFFDELSIPKPKYNLEIGGKSHGKMTGDMMTALEELWMKEKPNLILVYGDTNSTLAGALAAAKMHIPVVHVEAGLRSFNKKMPEEVNRILTDHVSELLLCPTPRAKELLESEGISGEKVVHSGDVMYDAVLFYKDKALNLDWQLEGLNRNFVLCTLHRAENTDSEERMTDILSAIGDLGEQVVLPLHPRTKKLLELYNLTLPANVITTEPLSYLKMIKLLSDCSFVITDSGGLQKESYFMGKYCITVRDETEWVELTENNVNFLVGSNKEKILEAVNEIGAAKGLPILGHYGDGSAGKSIVNNLVRMFINE